MGTVSVETLQVWPEPLEMPATEISLTRCPDGELAKRAGGGDMEAFEEMYRRHHRRVYGLCLRMTQNPAEAEDLTQEIFIHLFRTVGSFRGESEFKTWLYRLATNQVLMHFRKVKTRKERTTDDGSLPAQKVEGKEATGHMPVVDRVALDEAIAQLPPGYRMVFILHDVMGHDQEGVGRILGLAAGTSKSQLHKARMKLRRLLGTSASRKLSY